MGIFSNILHKLGIGDTHAPGSATESTAQAQPATPSGAPQAGAPSRSSPDAVQPTPKPISQVDVVAKLEGMAAQHPEKLNWKVSIVDLLKLLGLDSSLAARKELATELACPPDKMADSAQMNIWLHKTVMQKLAENGGNIPADLLH